MSRPVRPVKVRVFSSNYFRVLFWKITVKTVITWRSSSSMIPAPEFDSRSGAPEECA